MFLVQIQAADYASPWATKFAERLKRLESGPRRVAYFSPQPDNSTFRYRAWNMIEALEASHSAIGASWFAISELTQYEQILERADIIVLCRCKYSVAMAQLVARAHALGRRVVFDVDDLVFDDRYVHLIIETLDEAGEEQDLDFWFAQVGRYGALMRLCDAVIVTNEFLAERVHEFCGLPTAVVPNFTNRRQLEYSAQVLGCKRRSSFRRDERIHLGYFSGSATHQRDFSIIADALVDLLEDDPRTALRVVGPLELGPVSPHSAAESSSFRCKIS